ncbi:lipid droplet-associated perilipin protein [Moniliophthora roreri]|uniref:Lipid droplet-associated perilipin protein n=1 Tax=Moniliophthora roreri TaxID=221103 RepID=A0A0W0FSE8_MONRR|nr:lipid droplet-associated perilipin protein [Moniliophthora roreri]
MSATTTTTTDSQKREITIISRVAAIPLVHSSIESLNGTLSTNPYTRSPYSTALGLSEAAYKLSEPVQLRLAPIITRADEYANKAVDLIEARYPYPFKATPQDVYNSIHEIQQSYTNYAHRTIDERVKNPALHVAQGIDKSFAPIVNVFEEAVNKLNSNPNTPSSESGSDSQVKYQYQRVYDLSKVLRNELQVYSNEQLKELQNHSALVHRATETAHSLVSAANSSVVQAQARVQALSDTMISQIHKLQGQLHELSGSLQSSAAAAYHNSSQQIPELQKKLRELSSELHEIVVARDVPLQEKAARVTKEVKEHVDPLLETMKQNILDLLEKAKSVGQVSGDPVQVKESQNAHSS